MTDNEKTTGVPIDDETLDKVAGGVAITPDTAYNVRLLQPLDDFGEACNMIKTSQDRQNAPNDYYNDPYDGSKVPSLRRKAGI